MIQFQTRLACLTLFVGVTGCQFYARSPEDYRRDTRAVLEARQENVKACYETLLQTDPTAKGTVGVKFTVEKDTGSLKNAAVAPDLTTAPAPLGQCVVQSLEGLALTPPDKRDGEATFVWDFQPTSPPTATPVATPAG